MNILIFGGFGTLGRPLTASLRKEGHKVFIIDRVNVIEGEDEEGYAGDTEGAARACIITHDIQVVINLAEEASIGEQMSADPFSGLAMTASLLHFCATYRKNRVVTLLVTWAEPPPKQSSAFAHCAHSRKLLPIHYNKGNTVITELAIPRLIDPYQPESNFGAILNRVMYGLYYGHTISFTDAEYIGLDHLWCTTDDAIQFIQSFITRTTRDPQRLEGPRADFSDIVGFILDAVDIDEVTIQLGKRGPSNFRRIHEVNNESGRKLQQWIRDAAKLYIQDC